MPIFRICINQYMLSLGRNMWGKNMMVEVGWRDPEDPKAVSILGKINKK